MSRQVFLNYIFAVAGALVLSGCWEARPDEPLPEGVLPPERMEVVLTDLYLTEGVIDQHRTMRAELEETAQHWYAELLAHHDLTMPELRQSLQYYKKRPRQFAELNKAARKRLQQLQGGSK